MADSGEWRKIVRYMEATGVPFRAVSTYRPGAITATGRPSRHGLGLAVDFAGPKPSRDSDALLAIDLAFKPIASLLHELIYSGPGSYQAYNGARHTYSGVTRDNHHDHVHVSIDAGTLLPQPPNPQPPSDHVPTHRFPAQEDFMEIATDQGIVKPGEEAQILFPTVPGGWVTKLRIGSLAEGATIDYVVGGSQGERVNADNLFVPKGGASVQETMQTDDEYVFISNGGPKPVTWYYEAVKAT